jgi:hypothetical protein
LIKLALFTTAFLTLAATAASAATPAEILAANKVASGGTAWDSKFSLKIEYAYSGQGMTGSIRSTVDLKGDRWADEFQIGPISGANGFDGSIAWERDPSGTVTAQEGGEQRELAVNEGYRRANLWWWPDFGGAAIAPESQATESGANYEALTVTPKGGKPFTAWFDTKSHLLARIVEKQAALTVTTALSDYRAVDGVHLPGKLVVDDGRGAKYIQTLTFSKGEFGPALEASVFAKPNVKVADFSIAGGAKQTTLPIRILNNHIYGYAKVNGKGPYLFIFDTGGANLVTPATAKALGLKVEGQAPGGGAGEGTVDVGFAKVDSVQVGGATIKSQVFPVVDFIAPGVEGVNETGMIGFETFRRFVTRIDYAGGKLTLMKPEDFNAKVAGTPVPFVFHESIPEVQGTFEGIPTKFDIDTGSRSELTLTKPFAEKNGLRVKHPKGVDAVGGWGVGGPSRAYFTRGREMTLGTVKIDNIVTGLSTQGKGAFAGGEYDGNVGSGILKRFIVTFDYDHQIMYLKVPPKPVADTGTFDRAGMWINAMPEGFKIVDVTASGPAEPAGLQAGDIITAVDGKSARKIPVYEMRRRLRNQAPGTVVTFTVKREDSIRKVKVILRDLI